MSCHVCRCGDTAFCKCMCHTPPEAHAEAGELTIYEGRNALKEVVEGEKK